MNCYECATRDRRETVAVATCSTCGAAACVEHARVGVAGVHEHSPGNPALLRLPGRRVYCVACAPPEAVTPREATTAAGGVPAS